MKKTKNKEKSTVKCPYCGSSAKLVPASDIYGSETKEEWLYVCKNYPGCNSYVGVHKGTKEPKGTLADGALRNKRIWAHKLFDAIWQNGIMSRSAAYKWLCAKFSLRKEHGHIGCFSDYMCNSLMEECMVALKNNNISIAIPVDVIRKAG